MVLDTGNFLLIGSMLLFVSVVVGKAGFRFGVPVLVLFLGVGMLFGSKGLGIQFHNPQIAQFIGIISLSIILFSGGMDTKFSEIRPVLGPGIMMATVGVVVMTLVTGGCIYYLSQLFGAFVDLTLTESMLLAAVLSSTDSASVFAILGSNKKQLKYNIKPLLELESGSNDPMAYMLTIMILEILTWGGMNWWTAVLMFLRQMSIGAAAGFLLGHLAVKVFNRINIDYKSLYSVLLLATVFFIFSITDLVNGNGYLAVYIAGLVIGNRKVIHRRSFMTFFDGFTWLFQIVMFLTLGLLVNPTALLQVMGVGALVALAMIVFARPLMVLLCMAPFRGFPYKAKLYVSWVGLRGAVPIIFATYPLIAGVAHAQMFFNIVFCITLISLLLQGTSVAWFADLLGLSEEPREKGFGLDFSDNAGSSLSEIDVVPALLNNGDHLSALKLPGGTLVVMVRHEGEYYVPDAESQLFPGDKLLIISDNDDELRKTYLDMGIISSVTDR